eukprot:CAMPEP_0167802570 /NCGR_PEP_ID=MMETSP0111_2-20121227/19221_1 /TAXON_ID=91324 /ORGANISM="Lotharella globosa, Strain CCCM811" /LENGTH=79 /DNA_ID=CAMNT_0007698677 /DNA_START=52 /DNA_END=291 /DNA_ORIENTATION=-
MASQMTVNIKKLDGKKTPFNFAPDTKVKQVKEVLAEKTGIFAEAIRLIFQGSPMKDDQTLKDHNVKAGNVIHMILQLRG